MTGPFTKIDDTTTIDAYMEDAQAWRDERDEEEEESDDVGE